MEIQSTINVVFFATYVLFQPLAAVLVRKLGPRVLLGTITLLWGVTIIVGSSPSIIDLSTYSVSVFRLCQYLDGYARASSRSWDIRVWHLPEYCVFAGNMVFAL